MQFDRRWLTTDVTGVLDAIWAQGAYDRLPILADALQDAGCDDEAFLSWIRREEPWSESFGWFGLSFQFDKSRAPEADDVLNWLIRWSRPNCLSALMDIHDIVNQMGGMSGCEDDNLVSMSFSLLMNGADDWDRSYDEGRPYGGEFVTQMGSENWRNEFPVYAERFWNAWAILTDKTPEDRGSFFSCSC